MTDETILDDCILDVACTGDTRLPWSGAREFCQAFGMDLIVVDSQDEDAWAIQKADDIMLWTWWIGANDLDDDGSWQWLDAEPMSYTHWPEGSAPDASSSNCGVIDLLWEQWEPRGCDGIHKSICEPVR